MDFVCNGLGAFLVKQL